MGLREYTRRPPDCLAWSAKRRLHRRSGGRGMREGEQARVGMGRGSIGSFVSRMATKKSKMQEYYLNYEKLSEKQENIVKNNAHI